MLARLPFTPMPIAKKGRGLDGRASGVGDGGMVKSAPSVLMLHFSGFKRLKPFPPIRRSFVAFTLYT